MKLFKRMSEKLLCGLFCAVLLFSAGSVTCAAATNKAAQATVTFPKNVSEESIYSNGSFHITLGFNSKMTIDKKTTLSSEIYIPKNALKKKGSLVIIEPSLEITSNNWHTIPAKYNYLIRNKNGKIVVSILQPDGGTEKKASSAIATCKKKGNYYKLTIKKCPIRSTYTQWDGDVSTEKKVKKETSYVNQVYFVRCSRKLKKELFYWDNVQINAKKTVKSTYDKADYGEVFGYDYTKDKTLKVKIAKIQ